MAVSSVSPPGFALLLLWGFYGLPALGNCPGPYGDEINAVAVEQRHLTNMPSAVDFDYRGFDTLGEEYILFAAVTGLALLLRRARGEIEESQSLSPPSTGCRRRATLACLGLAVPQPRPSCLAFMSLSMLI